jgi:hypothetical protein
MTDTAPTVERNTILIEVAHIRPTMGMEAA